MTFGSSKQFSSLSGGVHNIFRHDIHDGKSYWCIGASISLQNGESGVGFSRIYRNRGNIVIDHIVIGVKYRSQNVWRDLALQEYIVIRVIPL